MKAIALIKERILTDKNIFAAIVLEKDFSDFCKRVFLILALSGFI
jgi:hypothetical protein